MSFAAIAKVATINAGDDKSKSVLLWLAFHLNDDTGLCCPSISLLRKETEVGSDNTIRAALARLREKGLVSWTREIEDGCVKRTLYTLHLDTAKVEPTSTTKPTSAIEVPQPMKGGASTVDGGYFNGCAGVPQPLKGNKEIEHGKEQGKEQGVVPRPASRALESDTEATSTPVKKTRAKPRTLCPFVPEDACPQDWRDKYAPEFPSLSIAEEFRKFVGHYVAQGTTFANWKQAFGNWLDNAVKFKARDEARFASRPAPNYRNRPMQKEDMVYTDDF